MEIKELKKGEIYIDQSGLGMAFRFNRMLGFRTATFNICEWSEQKGDYVTTDKIEVLTYSEIKRLITVGKV